jgi:hypothetical protein
LLLQVSLKSVNMDKHSLYLLDTPFLHVSSRDGCPSCFLTISFLEVSHQHKLQERENVGTVTMSKVEALVVKLSPPQERNKTMNLNRSQSYAPSQVATCLLFIFCLTVVIPCPLLSIVTPTVKGPAAKPFEKKSAVFVQVDILGAAFLDFCRELTLCMALGLQALFPSMHLSKGCWFCVVDWNTKQALYSCPSRPIVCQANIYGLCFVNPSESFRIWCSSDGYPLHRWAMSSPRGDIQKGSQQPDNGILHG